MRARSLAIVFGAVVSLALSSSAKAGKKKHLEAPAPMPVDELQSSGIRPAEQLAPYIQHIDQLLALQRPSESAAAFDQAPGHLALLRQCKPAGRCPCPGERAAVQRT